MALGIVRQWGVGFFDTDYIAYRLDWVSYGKAVTDYVELLQNGTM